MDVAGNVKVGIFRTSGKEKEKKKKEVAGDTLMELFFFCRCAKTSSCCAHLWAHGEVLEEKKMRMNEKSACGSKIVVELFSFVFFF